MKEVVEYVLAGIVLLSIIPIYDYIIGNLYSPPDLTMDYSLLNLITTHVLSVLERPIIYGNGSSPIFSFRNYVESRLGYILTGYAYRVEIRSPGIASIGFSRVNGTITIETTEPGHLNVLVIYTSGGRVLHANATKTKHDGVKIDGLYVYRIRTSELGIASPDSVVYVAAVLETPSYRYVNYHLVEGRAIRVSFTENRGVIAIAAPRSLVNASSYNVTLVFYNPNQFHWLSRVVYNETEKVTGNAIFIRETRLSYVLRRAREVAHSSNVYSIYNLTLHYREVMLRYRNLNQSPISETIVSESTHSVPAPIYNLLLAVFTDSSGRVFVAEWYPSSLSIGYTVPRELSAARLTTYVRLGMVDYVVTTYAWRVAT